MKSVKVIKSVILVLILSLTTTSAWSQQQCGEVQIYQSGDASSGTVVSTPLMVCDSPGGVYQQAVCLDAVPAAPGTFVTSSPPCDGGATYYIAGFPLTDATALLVFLLGIYSIYLYRQRRGTKIELVEK
jgi:hypothetical protein